MFDRLYIRAYMEIKTEVLRCYKRDHTGYFQYPFTFTQVYVLQHWPYSTCPFLTPEYISEQNVKLRLRSILFSDTFLKWSPCTGQCFENNLCGKHQKRCSTHFPSCLQRLSVCLFSNCCVFAIYTGAFSHFSHVDTQLKLCVFLKRFHVNGA